MSRRSGRSRSATSATVVTTSRPSRSRSQSRLRRCRSSASSKRFSTTTTVEVLAGVDQRVERRHREADAVDGAQPGVGDQDHQVGHERGGQGHGVAVVGGQRRADAAGASRPRPTPTPSGQASSSTRSASVNGGPAQHLGRHRRGHGDLVPAVRRAHRRWGSSPVARGQHARRRWSRAVAGRRRTGPACGPPRRRPRPAAPRGRRRPPRSCRPRCRCPTTTTRRSGPCPLTGAHDRSRVAASASAVDQRARSGRSVWAADSATRSREVPAGTVGGRMAGTSRP